MNVRKYGAYAKAVPNSKADMWGKRGRKVAFKNASRDVHKAVHKKRKVG